MTHVVDDFNRTDAATLGSDYASQWDDATSHAIVSNQAVNASDVGNRGNRRVTETFADDQWAEIEFSAALPSNYTFGVVLRGQAGGFGDENVGYYVNAVGTNGWQILRHSFGFSTLASGTLPSGTWVSGDTLRGEVIGTTIYIYRNGSLVSSTTDSDIASGKPGIFSATDGDTDIAITQATFSDVFGAGATSLPPQRAFARARSILMH